MKTMYYSEKTAARVIRAMLNTEKNDIRPFRHNTWIDDKGRQCSCDGYRAYRLNKPAAGLPDTDAINGIALEKLFPTGATLADYSLLELPSLADVKAMIAEDNARQKDKPAKEREYVYQFGKDAQGRQLPAVNLKYLADVMTIFPDAVAYCKPDSVASLLYFEGPDGDAILLPIRCAEYADKHREAPAPTAKKPEPLPVYGLRTFLALAAAANA